MSDQTANVFVVQFPHPGREHNPDRLRRRPWRMEWNTGDHRRKFMRSPGRYLDNYETASDALLTFWGEWEPPSEIIETWEERGSLPRFLHVPVWERNGPPRRQNTDPWVFGSYFRYSNCKQRTGTGNPSALQRLTRGSVLFFGSTISGEFVLDTVFVVKDACRYTPSKPLETDDAFRFCTIDPLADPLSNCAGDNFTLYRGATFDDRANGLYSFVPCQCADSRARRFARPSIRLPGYINPSAVMTPSGSTSPRFPKMLVISGRMSASKCLKPIASWACGLKHRS